MLDWWGPIHNSLWILGLAVCLSALSMASFRARTEGVPLRRVLVSLDYQLALHLGMILFCAGLLFSVQPWWTRVLWALAAVLFVVLLIRLLRLRRIRHVASDDPGTLPSVDSLDGPHRG